MKQIIKIIRKVDVEKQYKQILKSELDYELACLYDAMQAGDEAEKARSKKRLAEIRQELNSLKAYS